MQHRFRGFLILQFSHKLHATPGYMAVRLSIVLCSAFVSSSAWATNGFNLIGFGAESTLMGGADVAVARDTSALNTNPAGLTQISGQALDAFGSVLRTLDLAHKDQNGNNESASNQYTLLGGGGYASSLENMPCTAGVGLFAQGGAGGIFNSLKTSSGTKDTFSSLFGIAKITPGLGCQITDKLSLGASLGIVYARLDEKALPNTPVIGGLTLKNADTIRVGYKLGVQYRATPQLTLGAAYTAKTTLPLSGDYLKLNTGFGEFHYRDVRISGFALPQEVAFGAAFKADDALLLSLKLNWINWANALTSSRLRATDADEAIAPDLSIPATLNWKNQWVIATGLAYTLDEQTTLYAGYNYGSNPIPKNHTTPQLAGILEHHITLGAAYRWSPEWTFTGGLEYDPRVKVNYTNAELPFGSNTQLRNEALFLHFMVSRRW